MNLDTNSSKKPLKIMATDDMDFDFKPITSGLGFHNEATTDIKPLFHENRPSVATPSVPKIKLESRKEMNHQIYQNDLAMFYGRETLKNSPIEQQNAKATRLYFRLGTYFVLPRTGINHYGALYRFGFNASLERLSK